MGVVENYFKYISRADAELRTVNQIECRIQMLQSAGKYGGLPQEYVNRIGFLQDRIEAIKNRRK